MPTSLNSPKLIIADDQHKQRSYPQWYRITYVL